MADISVSLSSDSEEEGETASSSTVAAAEGGAKDEDARFDKLRVLLQSDTPIDFTTLRAASHGRPLPRDARAQCWLILLGVSNRTMDPFVDFDELYNLPGQSTIRAKCNRIFDALGNGEEDRMTVTSMLESVITFMCKQLDVQFDETNGWADVLQLLCALHYDKTQMYNAFHAIVTKYIPRGCVKDGKPFDLFRLLLLYHDPELCSFLDTRKITPDMYARKWFTSTFASVCDMACALPLWDVYLQQGDPFSVFFMSLVMVLNAKDTITKMGGDREAIVETLSLVPSQLGVDDIEDFCQLANYYASNTPQSFRRDYHGPLFGSNLAKEEFSDCSVHSLLCLPVSVQELLSNAARTVVEGEEEDVEYFVVDARPTIEYMSGHLPGAFNLDASLMVDSPSDYGVNLQGLIDYKARLHGNAHVCFMGGGEATEDRFVHMAVSQWLQRGNAHVSLARGGYIAVHDVLRESLSTRLKGHSVRHCVVCGRQAAHHSSSPSHGIASLASPVRRAYVEGQAVSSSILGKLRNSLASTRIVDKVIDYVANPNGDANDNQSKSSSGRSYRNIASSIFTIDDSEEEEEEEAPRAMSPLSIKASQEMPPVEQHPLVNLTAWAKDNDIGEEVIFKAQYVQPNSKLLTNCTACVTPSHLYILCPHDATKREKEEGSKTSPSRNIQKTPIPTHSVFGKRSLATVHKITSKKALPELITIKYGYEMNDGQYKITRIDRLLVPKAGELAKAIKTSIVAMKDEG